MTLFIAQQGSFLVQPRFEDDPVGWMTSTILISSSNRYVMQIRSLDQTDEALAHRIANEIIELLGGHTVRHVTFLPIAGLRMSTAPVETFTQPRTPPAVALHRYMLGAAEPLPADALIDFTIALEALPLSGMKEGELRFQFALHGARFGSAIRDERRAIFRELRDIYDIRSRLVHGAVPPDPAELHIAHQTAKRLASQLIFKALRGPWPSQETYAI